MIDLRANPGGDVQAATDMASLFLEPDQLIFTVKGRTAEGEEVRVKKLNRPYTVPYGGSGGRKERQRVGDFFGRHAGP